jgi:hypothetical protein
MHMAAPISEYKALVEEDSPQPARFRKLAAVATGLLLLAGCAGAMHARRASANAYNAIVLPADTSICDLASNAGSMLAYCNANSLDKALVSNGDCSAWYYGFDAHDVDKTTLGFCTSGGYSGCHVEDRGGSACFPSCGIPDFEASTGDTDDWGFYCAASTPKQWFMSADCSAARWSTGNNNVPEGMMLYSYNGYRCPETAAVGDMRTKIQGCLQYENEWCWATSITIVAGFYDPATYPNHDSAGPNCRGTVCWIVGVAHYPDDPDQCCQDKDSCNQPGTGADIVNMLTQFTPKSWVFLPSISEELLARVLQDQNPVIYGIAYPGGGGHVMTIVGTDGNGVFYVFDPFFVHGRGSFQSLTYDGLVNYQTPGYPGQDPSFGSGTMNQAYVPSQYANALQLSASKPLASRITTKKGFASSTKVKQINK